MYRPPEASTPLDETSGFSCVGCVRLGATVVSIVIVPAATTFENSLFRRVVKTSCAKTLEF